MSDTAPVAASGSPSFDRRSFLATLATAGVLTGSTVAFAADGADAVLLAIGAEMEVQREVYRMCGLRTDAAYDVLEDEPKLSDALRVVDGDFNAWPPDKTTRMFDEPSRTTYRIWESEEAAAMFRAYVRDTAAMSIPLGYFRSCWRCAPIGSRRGLASKRRTTPPSRSPWRHFHP